LPSVKLAELMMREVRMASIPGSVVGEIGEGQRRLSIAISMNYLLEAIERTKDFEILFIA